jgi:adenine phosphoribosyltransferase
MEMLRASLEPQDRVLVVDDWAETGSQATATRSLIERCGASYVGLSLLVDQLTDENAGTSRPGRQHRPIRRITTER